MAGALVLVFTACGGEASSPNTTTSSPTTTVPASTTAAPVTTAPATTLASATQTELTHGLPRAGNYAFFEVSIEAAAIGSVDPKTFLSDSPEPSEESFLFLTLHIANRSDTDGAIFNFLPYALLLDGTPQQPPVVVDGRSNVGLGPRAEADSVLAFTIPDNADFESMVFSIGEPDRIPTHIPLSDDLADPEFPVALAVSGEGPAQGGASGCNQSLDVTVFGGEAAIDLLESDAYPTAYKSRRANLGHRFLSVDLRVFNNGGSRCGAGATNYSPDSFMLLVDGVPRQPVTFVSGAIAAGAAEDLTVNFVYPTDATTLEFAVGDEAGTLFLIPVDVSEVPTAPGE